MPKHCLIAIREDLFEGVSAIPFLSVVKDPADPHLLLSRGQFSVKIWRMKLGEETLGGKTWNLYQLMVRDPRSEIHRKIYRFLKKVALETPGLRGPWTYKQFITTYPALAAKYLKAKDEDGNLIEEFRPPVVAAGEDWVIERDRDYNPTDSDCLDDIDIPEQDSANLQSSE